MSSPALLRCRRLGRCLVPLILAANAGWATAAPPENAPAFPWQRHTWQQATQLLFDDALDQLPPARLAHDPAERRALDYSRAVLLLNSQPKLQRNIDEACALLESVRQARADDDPGLSALYYLARIAEFHADPRDPAKAAALYAELIARAPAHPLAQEAVSRLATIRLYEDLTPSERQARSAEFESAAARLTLPGARRDLHFVLADVSLTFLNDPEAALRHFLAAEEAGIVRQQLAGETAIHIALLARQLGHRDVAVAHYKAFLARFHRDSRAYLLASQLRELEAAAAPSSASEPLPDASPAPATTPPPGVSPAPAATP